MLNTTTFRVIKDGNGSWAVSCPNKGLYIAGLSYSAASVSASQMNKDAHERSLVARSACSR